MLEAVLDGLTTPASISRVTKVTRPAVYDILKKLMERRLVVSRITNGKKRWQLAEVSQLEEVFYDAKKFLFRFSEGREEVYGLSDATVVIHRGEESIKELMSNMFVDHKSERLLGFQGNVSTVGWDKIFSTKETNVINNKIKKNAYIVEGVLPKGWFETQVKALGIDWAKEFEGRTARINAIDESYFNHGGQIFIFKKSLYLLALNEEIIIEVRNSEIQKMILSIFEFIQDNSQTIDGNALLRTLIEKHDSK